MYVTVTFIILLYGLVLVESAIVINGHFRRRLITKPPHETTKKRVSAIVCALLPNERNVLLDTVTVLLEEISFDSRNELILSIVSPDDSDILIQLEDLASRRPQLRLLKHPKIVGKFDQLNKAIAVSKNQLIYFLDADERPTPGILQLASRTHEIGKVYQGVTIPRNQISLFTKVVTVETAIKYLVGLRSRSLGYGNVYFCGSNSVWPKEVVSRVGFEGSSLVEDVEASVRAKLDGVKIELSTWMIANEVAPENLNAWWIQRRRWAKGWLDVGRLHIQSIFSARNLSVLEKADWFYLIYIRRVLLAIAIFAFWFFSILTSAIDQSVTDILEAFRLWIMVVIPIQILVATAQIVAVSYENSRATKAWDRALFWIMLPFYELLKCSVAIDAVRFSLNRETRWQVTPRNTRGENGEAAKTAQESE